MVGEACLPSNAYYQRTPDYTLYSVVHVCWSEHSDSSFVNGFMSLDYDLGTMTATTSILSSKFLVNWPFGSGEIQNRFARCTQSIANRNNFSYFFLSTIHPDTSYQDKKFKIDFENGGHLGFFDHKSFSYFWSTSHPDISHKVSSQLAVPFRRRIKKNIYFQNGGHGGHFGFSIETILAIFDLQVTRKKVREKSRESHNHKPRPFPDPKRERKPTNLNKHKPNKLRKALRIALFSSKRGNRNTKRTEKHKNKMTHERHTTNRLVE